MKCARCGQNEGTIEVKGKAGNIFYVCKGCKNG